MTVHPLESGGIASMWHEGTKQFYEVVVVIRPQTPEEAKGPDFSLDFGGLGHLPSEGKIAEPHPWEVASLMEKRLSGFCSYIVAAFYALLYPVEVDRALLDVLRDQFKGE